jgi:hypothetical protein
VMLAAASFILCISCSCVSGFPFKYTLDFILPHTKKCYGAEVQVTEGGHDTAKCSLSTAVNVSGSVRRPLNVNQVVWILHARVFSTSNRYTPSKKCSGGLLIAVIMGVLVDNTITKANNHFGPYCDNEAESTHGLYEIFLLRITSWTCWRNLSVSLRNTLCIYVTYAFIFQQFAVFT